VAWRAALRLNIASEFRYSRRRSMPGPWSCRDARRARHADTIAAARLAREQGATVIAVTNTVGSAITRESDAAVFLQAGPEIAVAATKTFVTQVVTLVMLAATLPSISVAERRPRRPNWSAPCDLCPSSPAGDRARRHNRGDGVPVRRAAGFMYIGRAFGYPAALEGALKIKEISYLHAEG